MVVTRRTPAAPVPTSRNPSSQPIPRLAKKAHPDAPRVPDKPSPLANGSKPDVTPTVDNVDVDVNAGASSKPSKVKGKQKQKKSGKKKSRGDSSFMEFLFRIFLLWFTIYTLSVCPQDEGLKSPVCRGLAEYRRLVLEPYVIPTINQALSHPSVAPYVQRAKPYADYAVRTVTPIAARAHKEFEDRLVPQWNKRVVPLYHKYAVPQLMKLDAQTAPYRTRVEHDYEQYLAPYLRRAASVLNQWQHQARPYVILAAQKTYHGYQVAQPYARPLWEKVKAALAQLTAILGAQRRQFVDPHVQKIWEHVKEMSSGKPQPPPASQLRSSASPQLSQVSSHISQAFTKASSILSSVASSVAPGSSAISSTTAKEASQTAPSVVSEKTASLEASSVAQTAEVAKSSLAVAADKASTVVSGASSALKSTASPIAASASSSLSSAVSAASDAAVLTAPSLVPAIESTVEASLGDASSVAKEIPSVVSSVVESATAAAPDVANETPFFVATSAAHESSSVAPSDNLKPSSIPDLGPVTIAEALDLTLDVADSPAEVVSSATAGTAKQEHNIFDVLSDPDLELFKAELGLKEDELLSEPASRDSEPASPHEEIEEEKEARLRARLEKTARDRADIITRHSKWENELDEQIAVYESGLRKTLVALRKAAVSDLQANKEIRDEVEGLVEDGEKFLRGAEKYLTNLHKENRKLEEKGKLWDRVVGKVEEKFSERLHQTEAIVNGWYRGWLDKEVQEVDKLTKDIKDLAERAQADIGLDYAYLDDVTYLDWQRYHDLARRSENFTTNAHGIQDGSHPSPPVNPVLSSINELQEEVDDVISGFNARLRKVKRTGARLFDNPEAAEDEDSTSILPIEEPEQTESLPEADVKPIVIGRGKEEVEAALNRVADLEDQKTSALGESEKVKDAEAVARSLSAEVASEDASASSPPLHQEL